MTDVATFKLDTGEEIISRVKTRNVHNNTIVLDKPRAIALMPGQVQGQMGMTLVPFMASNQDGEVTLFDAHVVGESTASKDLEDGYLQNTSGIELVTG